MAATTRRKTLFREGRGREKDHPWRDCHEERPRRVRSRLSPKVRSNGYERRPSDSEAERGPRRRSGKLPGNSGNTRQTREQKGKKDWILRLGRLPGQTDDSIAAALGQSLCGDQVDAIVVKNASGRGNEERSVSHAKATTMATKPKVARREPKSICGAMYRQMSEELLPAAAS